MRPTKRQIDILRYLNDCGEVELKQLCSVLGVTSSTVRTELHALEDVTASAGVAVHLTTGNIVTVEGAQNLPNLLTELASDAAIGTDELINLYLIFADDFVTMRGCRQPEHRPILAAMDDPQRDSDLRTGDQPGDRQAQLA